MKNRKIPTREEYKEKFDRLFSELNYIPQAGEEIVQCGYPYPDYWFLSNKGYLFTVWYNTIKVVKPYGSHMGFKNKDGNRGQNDWYYLNPKTSKKVRHHKLVSEYFAKDEFAQWKEFKDESRETHHKINKSKFNLNEPQKANNIDNLQILPLSVHREVTHYANMTDEKEEYELRKKLKKMNNPTTTIVEGDLTKWAINQLQKNLELGNHAYVISRSTNDGMTAKAVNTINRP